MKTVTSVLIVTSEFPPLPGGIGNHALHLATHLSASGYQVTVIADQRSQGPEDVTFDATLDLKVHRIRLCHFRFLMYLQRCMVVFKMIKQHHYIIATGKFPLWLVGFYSLFFEKKYLAVIHGSEVNLKQRFFKGMTDASLKQFDAVIAVSNYTQSLVASLNLKHVTVIPNAIDAQDWDLGTSVPLNLKGSPKLLTVGRLSERKGQLEVIRHLPKLIAVYPNVHYHCVGLASEAPHFKAVAEQLGVGSHVTFHGPKSQAELKAFYLTCDVFVMFSRSTKSGDVEGFGIAILEANALGVPAIGAKGSGIEDAIQQGFSGFLIDPKDSNDFESALKQLLAHKEGFSKQAKAWAQEHDWKLIIDRYVAVMESN